MNYLEYGASFSQYKSHCYPLEFEKDVIEGIPMYLCYHHEFYFSSLQKVQIYLISKTNEFTKK